VGVRVLVRAGFDTAFSKLLATLGLLVSIGCTIRGQVRAPALKEKIVEGKQYAHYLQFPSGFNIGEATLYGVFRMRYDFRTSAASPTVLLVSACGHKGFEEICGSPYFAIDTAHGYSIRPATASEWQEATKIKGLLEMDAPGYRDLKEEMARPAAKWVQPIEEGPNRHMIGYQYLGKKYIRRGSWISGGENFGHSDDEKLMILTGADTRGMPPADKVLFNSPAYNGAYGRFSVDVFYLGPENRIAALDIDCNTDVIDSLSHVSLINSRWVAIGLDAGLQKMLLFDFQGRTGK
jgi:hypothetical protein